MKNKWLYVSIFILLMVVSLSIWYFYLQEEQQVVYKGTFVRTLGELKG